MGQSAVSEFDQVSLVRLVENLFLFFSPHVSQYFDIMSKLYVLLFNIWVYHSINKI